ncbi:dTMP kinase [Caldicellulosiruptoraceae bacterium PP1]
MNGRFIVFEGNDGAGKSTQIAMAEKYLKNKGIRVLTTREPGGTEVGYRIRKLLLDPEYKMDGLTEAFLLAADRNEHVRNVIIPALKEGYVVLSDRYILSSIVYQGMVRGVGIDKILKLNMVFEEMIKPDLYIVLTLHPKYSLERLTKGNKKDRLDSENLDFHLSVYKSFKEASQNKPNIVNIEALGTEEQVFEKVKTHLDSCLDLR